MRLGEIHERCEVDDWGSICEIKDWNRVLKNTYKVWDLPREQMRGSRMGEQI